ncbi:hypothetical protein Barb4_02516 [Bacteroidales bacterium Barb4]|nr:hypothetical protein Barb4_02516 [Bacteroidales bacterium Barb4]
MWGYGKVTARESCKDTRIQPDVKRSGTSGYGRGDTVESCKDDINCKWWFTMQYISGYTFGRPFRTPLPIPFRKPHIPQRFTSG